MNVLLIIYGLGVLMTWGLFVTLGHEFNGSKSAPAWALLLLALGWPVLLFLILMP